MFEKKFLMPLFCLVVVLSFSATATRGANILFVSSMTAVEDDALKAFMEGLGHTVTYIDDDEDEATTEAAAAAADLVFISESVGSGGIKNEITEIEVPMIVGEPWAWDEMGLTEGDGGDDPAVTTDVEIVDPGHYLASGLSGTVAVLTDILEGGNLGKGITGPEATVIATATLSDGVTYDVIFVYEKGAALPVAPADGSAQVAADIRIGFGFHAICYPVLSENAYALLGAAVDYALGLTGPVAEVDGRLIVPKTSVAPIIDGELDDVWQNVGEESLLITEIINATSAVPEDASDLSGTFQVMYDDDNFYIYVVIQDSVIDYEFSDWNGDGVEFFFDGDNSKGSSYDGVNDNQIRITVDDVELANIDSSLPVDGSDFKVVLTDLGYNIEASFPLETLQIVPENTFGFEVQLNDNDGGGGRETMIRWFSNDNNSWQDASLFGEAVLTAGAEAEGPILKLDVGNSHNAEELEEGFTSFTLAESGSDVDGITIEFGGINSDDSRRRGEPSGVPYENIYRDFIFGRQSEPGVGYVTVTLSGLGTNQTYGITLYSWDTNSTNIRIADWTANGKFLFSTIHDGNVNPPAAEDDYAYTGVATADANGVILMEAVPGEGTFAGEPFAFINALVLVPIEPVDPGTDGLVAYYAFENDANDSSGNELHGTLVGDAKFAEGLAGYGMALELDGDGDYVDCGTPPELVITEVISIACWVNPAQLGGEQGFAGLDAGYSFKAHGEGVRFTTPGILDHSSANLTLEAGVWQHVAATFQPGQDEGLVFYLNGVETERMTSSAINAGTGPFRIGNNQWNELLTGLIDEVAIYNRALSEGEIMYLAGFRPGPVAHYKLDEGEGVIAVDSSGNGNDGTLEDGPTVVDGQFGQALAFEDSRIAIPASDSLTADLFQGTFTLSAWINPKRTGDTWQQIFRSMISADTSNDTLFLNNDGRLSWRGRIGGAWAGGMCETASDVVPADQWTHFAVTGDGTNFRIYVNGALSQESAFQTTDGTNATYYIGGDPTWIGESYSGMIDEVRIYDRALSADEVSGLAGKAVDPSLVIYYTFDEVSDIVADQSGKGHDGVVVGDVTAEPEGMYNGAANFATNSYLDLDGANFPAEDIPTSAMTLAAWIKCANTGLDHEIFNARASDETWIIHPEPKSSGDIRWLLRSYGGTTIFQIRNGTMTWDEWLHFAGTYDKEAGKAALYINGELIEEMDVTDPADIAGDWGLGARVGMTVDYARPFTGLMDEFRMYTRALSQDEILTIMQGM